MYHINQEEFQRNLLLTQAYCALQLQQKDKSVAEILRSINLEHQGSRLFYFTNGEQTFVKWIVDPLYNYDNENLYSELFEIQLSYKKEITKQTKDDSEYKGKILIVEIDCVIRDGISEWESNGLIDENDCPPIDSWFYLTRNETGRHLFAWIPEELVKLADDAVDVNMLNTMNWYEG